MASTFSKTLAIFLVLNLVSFSIACPTCGGGIPYPKPNPKPHLKPSPSGGYPGSGGSPSTGGGYPGSGGSPSTGGGYPGSGGSPSTGGSGTCPIDALKLGVCANVLNGLINATIGAPPKEPCCPLIEGLVDLEAAVCLCTAIRANILGIHLNLPISLSLLVNYCGKNVPRGFQCP